MSIENFLNNFDEHNKQIEDAKVKKESAESKKKMENEQYLIDFQEYYSRIITTIFKEIEEKLADKFEMNIPTEPILSQGSYFYKIELTPNFKNYVEKVVVEIISEGERRLITLSGRAYGPDDKNLGIDGLHRFQGELKEFKETDLENEVTEILNKTFVRKKPGA
jgi:hypothetical protein